MASDSWTHCLCPFPAHQGSQVPIQSLTPTRQTPNSSHACSGCSSSSSDTEPPACVHSLLRPFSSASSTQTTKDIISSLTPVSLPWTPPAWVYDGTLASSTQHLLVACRMKKEERKASHFQNPEKPAFLSPLGQKLGWPRIPSRSNCINRP